MVARLGRLPPGALLLTEEDSATFGAWYVQTALGVRQDVLVVDTRLLAQAWYRAQVHGLLGAPQNQTLCDALQASGRPLYRLRADGNMAQESSEVWQDSPACYRA